MASHSRSVSSRGVFSTWNARRWALLAPHAGQLAELFDELVERTWKHGAYLHLLDLGAFHREDLEQRLHARVGERLATQFVVGARRAARFATPTDCRPCGCSIFDPSPRMAATRSPNDENAGHTGACRAAVGT